MFDTWAFLLQTLTASGVALLLLAVKSMFRDKLPPKWQFAIWGILGLSLLIPAGMGGRYVLFNWPLVVETLKTVLAGEYTITRVSFPFPALREMPRTFFDWIHIVYVSGAALWVLKYTLAYIRLRAVLRRGQDADAALTARILDMAARQNLRPCRIVTVPGLPSAFVCGVLRPVLALPADTDIDDKVLLHELLHLKSRDTVWSIVICFFRCVHWCNPLLAYCANQAGNDLEARCDQRVLELLEGEDRRDYGRILLAMANDRFAKTPGSTCVSNGGRNIRSRIESIARFKRYPAGMGLVSVCAAIMLGLPMLLGAQETQVMELSYAAPAAMSFASARTTCCTTPAGAFDTYGKAILNMNGIYRAMCAPEDMQKDLAETVISRHENGKFPNWLPMEDFWPNEQTGYFIYNLEKVDDAYEGLLVIERNYPPDGQPGQEGMMYLVVQNLRVEKENGRWVAIALEDFRNIETPAESLSWGCEGLPAYHYTGTAGDFHFDFRFQKVYEVVNAKYAEQDWFFGPSTLFYDLTPKPDAVFGSEAWHYSYTATHLGTQAQRDEISRIGIAAARVMTGEERPVIFAPGYQTNSSGSNSSGQSWSNRNPEPGWGPALQSLGGGSKRDAEPGGPIPAYYAVDLYINGEKTAEVDLYPEEGGPR